MKKPNLVLTSDWHLERAAWAKHPTLTGDSYYSVRQIIQYAMDNRVSAVLAAGDLFDKPTPDSNSVGVAIEAVSRLATADIPLYFTQGQHEKVRGEPWFSVAGANYAHKQLLDLDGVIVYGLDYTRPDILKEEIANIPESANLLMMHQVWRNFMGELRTTDGDFEMLPPVDLILTGDFHKALIYNKNDIKAVSPGSICMQSIDEESSKSFFVLNDDFSISKIPLKARKVFRYIINSEYDLQKFLDVQIKEAQEFQEDVPDYVQKNIVDVKYNMDLNNVFIRLTKHVGDRVHLFMRALHQNKEEVSIDRAERQKIIQAGLGGSLKLLCKPDSELYKSSLRMLESNDPAHELQRMYFEKLGREITK